MAIDPIRVTVIGAGGVGSIFSEGIARQLEFQAPGSILQIVDGDTFEPKNAERQFFRTFGNKAQALRTDLKDLAPSVFIIAKAAWVVSEEFAREPDDDDEDTIAKITAQSIMNEDDFVFVVTDNLAARKLVFDAAAGYENIDVFAGGNGSPETGDALFGSVYHYQRRNALDVTANPAEYHIEYENPPDRNTGELSCEEKAELDGGTQLVAVNMAVAAQLLAKCSLIIFGTEEEKGKAAETSEIYFDLGQGRALPYERLPVEVKVSA